jgi:hypothetical protein
MRKFWIKSATLLTSLVALLSLGSSPATLPSSKQLFSKDIERGGELRVFRDNDLEPSELAAVLDEKILRSLRTIQRYHADLLPPGRRDSVVIWSSFVNVCKDSPADYSAGCMDAACHGNQFIAVFSDVGELLVRYQDFGPMPQSGEVSLVSFR